LRPDLLLTHNWGAIEWALANRFLPLCRHVHFESGFGSVAEATYRRRVLLRRLALGRAELIVVPSAALYDLATRTWGIDAARVVFVPNGVDLALFGAEHPTEIHPTLAGIAADVIVGTVTSLRPEKNLGRLIRAFAVATAGRRAHLVIAGSGPEQPTLEAAAHAAGVADRVRFAGYVDDPHRLIPGFDIYAMSSNTEQMPNALIQAMAARRAIASTDVGDIKRIVAEPNRAFVVAPEDEAALAGALARLMDDADLRARLGEANRDRAVARYDIERMTAAYRAVFDGTPLPPGNERPDAP
jgi:glycosyltransferase involved in cell wall biosynthesis